MSMSFGERRRERVEALEAENRRWRALARGLWNDLKHAEPRVADHWLIACADLRAEVERGDS